MTTNSAALGLLLDVDGPIASPVTRTITIDSIVTDLAVLAEAGTPIVFNTGRSDAFIREQVFAPLLAAGLDATAPVHAVCEKGAVWFSLDEVDGTPHVEPSLGVSDPLRDAVRTLVTGSFSDTMFVDETKRTMISVEQKVGVPEREYQHAQERFDRELLDLVVQAGVGVQAAGEQHPDADGVVTLRVDSTIIATDLESVSAGKDLGAQRALDLVDSHGPRPGAWRTMGDSRTDYAMADWLHGQGLEVVHIDVRPSEGMLTKPYRVLGSGDLVHDEAGAVFLRRWVSMLQER